MHADEINDAFDSLYGEDLRSARATRDKADDLALARRLVTDAAKAADQPELLTLMCRTAYELTGQLRKGRPTAVRAMELTAEHVPQKRIQCLDTIVDLRRQVCRESRGVERLDTGEQFVEACLRAAEAKGRAGHYAGARALYRRATAEARRIRSARLKDIEAATERLTARQRVANELKLLRARLKANPADKSVRKRLIELHVMELDDPAAAEKLLNDDVEDPLRTHVRLAVGKPQDLSEAACLGLAEWYQALAARASACGKAGMLKRAILFYDAFGKRHPAKDLFGTRAELGKAKAQDALTRLTHPGVGQWIDLLKLANPSKHVHGDKTSPREWKRTPEALVSPKGSYNRLDIPISPRGQYELEVKFAISGKKWEDILVLFPGGEGRTHLRMGPKVAGLATGSKEEHFISEYEPLDIDREHVLKIRVLPVGKQVAIIAHLDGRRFLAWQGKQRALDQYHIAWQLEDPTGVGLGAHHTQCSFRSFRLRMLSGKAVRLKLKGPK